MKLIAGAGGKGACTFHSEPRKEWGGPDGGNGGDGGNIIIKGKYFPLPVHRQTNTVCHLSMLSHNL